MYLSFLLALQVAHQQPRFSWCFKLPFYNRPSGFPPETDPSNRVFCAFDWFFIETSGFLVENSASISWTPPQCLCFRYLLGFNCIHLIVNQKLTQVSEPGEISIFSLGKMCKLDTLLSNSLKKILELSKCAKKSYNWA